MNVQNLLEVVNNNKNKMLKGSQYIEFLNNTLEVKKYLSIKEKKSLIDDIIADCVMYEDGVYKFDDIDKYITFTMKTIAAYTNIELSVDIEDDYDELCKSNLLNLVIETFAGEYDNVKLLLQMKCDYILSKNNIEAQIGKLLSTITDKLNDFASALSSKIDDFDFSNLNIDTNDIDKMMSFLNTQIK